MMFLQTSHAALQSLQGFAAGALAQALPAVERILTRQFTSDFVAARCDCSAAGSRSVNDTTRARGIAGRSLRSSGADARMAAIAPISAVPPVAALPGSRSWSSFAADRGGKDRLSGRHAQSRHGTLENRSRRRFHQARRNPRRSARGGARAAGSRSSWNSPGLRTLQQPILARLDNGAGTDSDVAPAASARCAASVRMTLAHSCLRSWRKRPAIRPGHAPIPTHGAGNRPRHRFDQARRNSPRRIARGGAGAAGSRYSRLNSPRVAHAALDPGPIGRQCRYGQRCGACGCCRSRSRSRRAFASRSWRKRPAIRPDMLNPDMELETDLGIDSIKRVEILAPLCARRRQSCRKSGYP